MYTIDRAIAIVKPLQPFADWLNANPDNAGYLNTLEELRQDNTAYLIPDCESEQEARGYIREICEDIFAVELESWVRNPATWPRKRDYAVFQKWFEVEIHSLVLDPYENDITKDVY